jgi:hypothetical protein
MQGMAPQGEAWHGEAGPGRARLGRARHGTASRGEAWQCAAGPGRAWLGAAWQAKARQGDDVEEVGVQTFLARIEGITAYLMHAATEEQLSQSDTRQVRVDKAPPREQASKALNQLPDGKYFVPSAAIARLVREQASNHKQRGSRKSMKYVVPGAVFQTTDALILLEGTKPAKNWEVDSRPVTIPATKGRIMRHRARFEKWSIEFALEVDDSVLPPEFVLQLLTEGGRAIGIGDYRPEKGGPFGRFQVVNWEQLAK